ncbi:hypothetical protein Bca52824_054691 [Brassica carinata]|uniref:Uncharacterized protein n=1 Tax=Brassica carinata TaxID=52824 RepID=A0A8X7UMX9_BRACI|nr:hypothetical protein Bca52824_054691 [Brassica carinata]
MELIDRVVLSKESSEVASTENLFFGKAVEKEESDFRDRAQNDRSYEERSFSPRSASESDNNSRLVTMILT